MHKIEDDIYSVFPTTMLHKKIGDDALNKELVAVVDRLADAGDNVANVEGDWVGGNSSYGSTQSTHNLFLSQKDACVQTLKQSIETEIERFLSVEMKSVENMQLRAANKTNIEISDVKYEWYGWTVRMSKDDWNGLHIHPNSNYSGVYYLSVPDLPYPEGTIQLINPHPIATAYGNGQPAGDFYPVSSGDLIIFPSWLSHLVMPFRNSNDMRYCLAFNVVVEKFWSEKQ